MKIRSVCDGRAVIAESNWVVIYLADFAPVSRVCIIGGMKYECLCVQNWDITNICLSSIREPKLAQQKRSLLVEQRFDVWHHVVWVDAVGDELDDLALTVEQVLGEVPLDLTIGRLRLQVLVEGRG